MSKIEWVLGIIIVAAATIALTLKFTVFKNTSLLAPTAEKKTATPTPAPETKAELTYKDEAGFSFQYPKGVTVSDKTPEDETYYTLLELERNREKGTISAKDTISKNLEDWLAKDKDAPQNPTLSGATTLDNIKATQYKSGGKIFTIAIDKGVIYKIETPGDNFWSQTHDILATTFKFEKTSTSPGKTAPSDTTYEEEVTVE